MQLVFIAACIGAALLFWHRKKIDPMLLGFAACLVYFSPGLRGRIELNSPGLIYDASIEMGAYWVMVVVVVITTAAAWCVDQIPSTARVIFPTRYVPHVLLTIAAAAGAVSLFTVGRAYFCDKAQLLPSLDRWYYLSAYALPLCVATAWTERRWIIFSAAVILLLADSLVGFYAGSAVALMATALLYGHARVAANRRALIVFGMAVLIGGLTFMLVRHLVSATQKPLRDLCVPAMGVSAHPTALGWRAPLQSVLGSGKLFALAWLGSEPVVIQASLNEVVRRDFRTGSAYLVDQLKNVVPLANSLFGVEAVRFNQLYQPALFPTALFGMANNPWAQAYAAGGYAMVALFSAVYAAGLAVLTLLLRVTAGAPQASIAVLAAWWGFYAHRNDVLIEIGIIKFVLYIVVTALLAGWLLASKRVIGRERPLG